MKIIEFIRLLIKHKVLLIAIPLLLAGLVILLTLKPKFIYASQTILYTGLASGSSIEMDKKFNYMATNTAFDNLINIINSRETQEEVAIRLLSQHLLLPAADQKYISSKLFDELQEKIPQDLYDYVVTDSIDSSNGMGSLNQTSNNDESLSFANTENNLLFPSVINRYNYEKTVENLTALMKSSSNNFVYELLNYEDEHYSIKAISEVKAVRISNSDLIKLSYQVNDPGICQQTLAIYNEVCIRNYKYIKENRSDAVVKYFETQLAHANNDLKEAETKLLNFNKSYNIINYYEQSKAVAVVKEEMEVDYNNKKAQLAGTEAATKRLEEKLDIQQDVQLKSEKILEKKKELGDLNFQIAMAEAASENDENSLQRMELLTSQSAALEKEISEGVTDLYSHQNSVDGMPINDVLPQWMDNVIESENLKAKMEVMDQRNTDFQKQYAVYAPAGANIKKIEREISVSEQGYLELLHGLNLAKLKSQDNELSSNLKTIDPPFFPLSPIPTKRKLLIIGAVFIGFIFVFGTILVMEYFDDTLKNAKKASEILKLPALGMMPKILLNPGPVNMPFIQKRLTEILTQNLKQSLGTDPSNNTAKTILFVSTNEKEGKTVMACNIARKLIEQGKSVLVLNYSKDQQRIDQKGKSHLINNLMGYPDPRIDIDNAFLDNASNYLQATTYLSYHIDEQFYKTTDYKDILEQNGLKLNFVPDYVFIELPSLIHHSYPTDLVAKADMSILVCRSNRLWTDADQSVLNGLNQLTASKTGFIINGVEIKEVETVLGDLPKKRTRLRTKIKNVFQFQFYSKNHI
ncbi:hypothetical protein QWY87_09655 [Lutimonas halocynthiae]|uniref:exopolysaccharide transport family protein n=1 Tax=Lutimonas halocynthiae TaxID=1446477 RepID=UPI0025B33429|nr:hypothetical protein [Lutimonas halocynthiae]MDN3642965.1 hypothetical protein [Lutimonas halocynthiae]